MQIGIVGLPNVGKSTLFNTLTKKQVEASNYPFCTIDPNVGVVQIPDKRLEKLNNISDSAKIIPTIIEFVDIAGLVKGAHKGEGLGNKFLANIRECDAICEVVRVFEDKNVVHVAGQVNPNSDRETINLELIFADLSTVSKALEKVKRDTKSGDKEKIQFKDLLEKLKKYLENGKAVRELEFNSDEKKSIKSLNLLTQKPIIYVLNSNKQDFSPSSQWDGKIVSINIKLEEEIAQLPKEEQAEYIKELGLEQSGLDKLIKASYELLGLITFFTTGKQETRAWTTKKDSKAPIAAGVIHSDFENKFIRAEVISYKDFINANGEAGAKELGLMRTEGKDYIIQDGDVCHFLIS